MAFCAAIATAVTLGACGSGLPGNAVAQIGSVPITQAQLNHWLTVANDSTRLTSGTKPPALPLPPNYTACVNAQLAALPASQRSSAGQRSTAKTTCASQYQQLVSQILNYLIFTIWIQGDANDRHVKVTTAEVDKAFNQARKQSTIPLATTKQLNNFLAETGQTIDDLKWRTMINVLGNKIEAKIAKQAQHASKAEIQAYYDKNRSQFTVSPTRALHLVLTTSLKQAQKVRSLLASGQSYATVAPKYSTDPTTKSKGGQMVGVVPGELTAALSKAVFAAKVGALTGPVKTPFGYYVFTVDSAKAGSVQSVAKATPAIKSQLAAQAVQKWQQSGLQKRWQSRTQCRSGVYQVSYCANAAKTASSGV